MVEEKKDDLFDEANEVQSNWWGKGKPGDQIKGTLVDVKEMDDNFNPGEKVKSYEFLAESGSFHKLDENKAPIDPAIEIQDGEFWMVGGNKSVDAQMRNIKIGQIVGIRFVETKKSKTKGFADSKVIKIYQGKMNEEWLESQKSEVEQEF